MKRLLILLSLCLLILAWSVPAEAGKRGKKKAKRPSGPNIVEVLLSWDFGTDRRGAIEVHACSLPLKNRTSSGDCIERDLLDEPLIDFMGSGDLRLIEGAYYTICFVAQNTVGKSGQWGACKVVQAIEDAEYHFTSENFTYWGGGPWQEP